MLIAVNMSFNIYKGFPVIATHATLADDRKVGLRLYNRPVVSDTALWPE